MNKFLIAVGIGAGLIIAQTAASAAASGLILSAPAEVAVAPSASAERATAPMDRVTAGAASYDLTLVDTLGTQVPGQDVVQDQAPPAPQEPVPSSELPPGQSGPGGGMGGGAAGGGGGMFGGGAGGIGAGGGLLAAAGLGIGLAALSTSDDPASPGTP